MAWVASLAGSLASAWSASKSGSSSSSKSGYTKSQKALLDKLINQVSTGMGKASPSSPSTYIPETEQETSFMSYVNNLMNKSRTDYLASLANGTPAYTINANATEQYFRDTILPQINEQYANSANSVTKAFSGPTYWGTDRMNALARLSANQAQETSSSYANLVYSDELARRTALENAANRAIDAVGAQSYVADLGRASASLSREIQESNAADMLSRYLMGEKVTGAKGETYYNNTYNPNIALALSLLGLGGTSTSSTTTGANALTGLVGGFGNWAANANWSDVFKSFK